MVWILTAGVRALARSLGCLVLVHEIEVDVVDHGLLLAHVARAGRLDGPEATTANFLVHVWVVIDATTMW